MELNKTAVANKFTQEVNDFVMGWNFHDSGDATINYLTGQYLNNLFVSYVIIKKYEHSEYFPDFAKDMEMHIEQAFKFIDEYEIGLGHDSILTPIKESDFFSMSNNAENELRKNSEKILKETDEIAPADEKSYQDMLLKLTGNFVITKLSHRNFSVIKFIDSDLNAAGVLLNLRKSIEAVYDDALKSNQSKSEKQR